MAYERSLRRYRDWYAKLLRFYPKPHRERFGEEMEQTFNDLCRERKKAGDGLFGFVLWLFVETSVGIIKENITFMPMQNTIKSIARVAVGTGLLLLIPLTLQLTIGTGVNGQGWNWELEDFVVMGALLFIVGLAIEAVRKLQKPAHRIFAIAAILLVFLLTWAHLAVGIVDSWPFAGS